MARLASVRNFQPGSGSDDLRLIEYKPIAGTVAIVDDDAPLCEALGSVLKAAGFAIATYATAEEFLADPRHQTKACLILDVRLPGMNGIELQRELGARQSQIPIIFVSAHGDASVRDLVMRAGAASFLSKPVRSASLLNEMCRALEQRDTE
jgi:FixJ family two-component response regulator